jgi:pseudomonalisin
MRLSRRGVVALASVAVLGSSGVAAVASSTTASVHLVRTRAVLPGLANAESLGAVKSSIRLTVGLGLAHPDPAGERRLYQALYDAKSPLYRHFLTPSQYAEQFGVRPATVKAAESWLRSGGLKDVGTDAAGDYVTATGTVAQISKLMHVRFGTFRVGTVRFIANTIAPMVPSSLPVTGVLGLDTLHRSYTPSQVQEINRANGVKPAAVGTVHHPAGTAAPYAGLLTPQNLWGIYDMPDSNMGQGQSAGLFMEGYTNSVIANLRVYERRHHLLEVPVRVVRGGKGTDTDFGDNTDAIEWYLDSDAISGMAPKLSQLDLYTATNLFDVSIGKTFATWADDPHGPLQMNASFGECEAGPANPVLGPLAQPPFYYGTEAGDELESVAEPILMHANLEGRTLFASTGDTGGSCPAIVVPVLGAGNGVTPQPVPEQNYPAASPHVTAVAGTVEETAGKPAPDARASRASEVGWTYSGGGSSFYIAEPSYQKGMAQINHPCVSRPDGTPYPPGTICRGVADVADMSGTVFDYQLDGNELNTNFYDIEQDMTDSGEGGTSLASPLAVGMWSRIQAGAPSVKGLGFANETFYRLGKSKTYSRDFYDVTKSETAGGNFYYQAGPGWDYVSGWGAMDVKNILRDVDHRLTPSHPGRTVSPPMDVRACSATMRSPANNANNALNPLQKDPSLDIRAAGLRQKGNTLIASISGPTLSTTPATGASGGGDFVMAWTVGTTTYFAEAVIDGQGNVSYIDGLSKGGYQQQHTIKGSFSQHTFTMIVPLEDVGSPKNGTVLAYPYAFAQYGLSGPTVITNPLYFTEDVATAGQPAQGVKLSTKC